MGLENKKDILLIVIERKKKNELIKFIRVLDNSAIILEESII
jgi:uncharacterized membrane-anchored protein YitT (DUF2179 family)